MSDHSLQLVEALRRRLHRARRRVLGADLLFGLVLLLGASAAALGLGAAAEAGLWMASGARWAFVAAFALLVAGLAAYGLGRPLLRYLGLLPGLSDEALAARAGRRYPEISDRLSALLDLASGRASEAPAPLLEGALEMLGREVEPVPFERLEDLGPARRAAPLAAAPLVGVLLFGLAAPAAFTGALGRLFAPSEHFAPPAPFALHVEPGDVELLRGADLEIAARARGRSLPAGAVLRLRREGEARSEALRLGPDSAGVFRHTLANVRASLRYRVEAEGVESRWFEASVASRPAVQGLQLTLRPPAYTGLPPQRLEANVGDVAALPGTEVTVRATTGGEPARSAHLVFEGGAEAPMELAGTRASGAFTVRADDRYHLRLVGENGHESADPITHTVQVLTDAPPQIRLLAPGDADLSDALQTTLRARITDDFGFARLRLRWRRAGAEHASEDAFEALEIPLTDPRLLDQDVEHFWLLTSTGAALRPGEALEYFLEVWDNDTVSGPKRARTPTHTLRLPSLSEQYEQLDEAKSETTEGLEDVRRDADEARQHFEELRDELRRKQDADWEDRRQIESLIDRHEQLEQHLEQSAEQMQEVLDQMRQHDLVSEETLRMYEELQRVIEEIKTPELLEALQKLQEAMQNLDPEQMMEALENFEFNEQSFRDRLERALELLERMEVAQKLDEAARRAEDLARREEALQEQTGRLEEQQGDLSQQESQAEQDRLAQEQEAARQDAEALEEMMEQLREKMEQMRGAPKDEMEQMLDEMQGLPQQMQENAEQLQMNQLQDAQQGQEQMQRQLRRLQQQMQEMQIQMSGQQNQANTAALRRTLDDVLTLSYQQEDLRAETAPQPGDSPALRASAQRQVELSAGLATVSDTLRALSRQIPEMDTQVQRRVGESLREMGRAVETLTERSVPQAAGHQKASMAHLNDLALLLADLLDQMMEGAGSGSGGEPSMQQLLDQLQQMSGEQQQLNQQLQEFLNATQGQRLTQDQQGRLEQLRQQQEALRQQLEEMARSGELDAQGRSQLQRIAEEMEEVARQMEGGRLGRETVRRQEEILHRLLEARESIHERGRRPERESRPGQDMPRRERPPELPPPDEIDRLRRDLIRALESGYAPDYQELIKRYFELLQQRHEG